jgi:Uma2 family endonuclease
MPGMSAVLEYPQRHAISVEEYLRMGEAGVFAPEAHLELIEGEIIEMAPIGSLHAGTVAILDRLLGRTAGDLALVWVQNPLIVGEQSVPQPDLALLKPRADSYTRSHPIAADVLLVVEVADTTLAFDLGTKVPLYARAGIVEAWVVDLPARALRVFRHPGASGYGSSFAVSGEAKVNPAALPEVAITVAALFPE